MKAIDALSKYSPCSAAVDWMETKSIRDAWRTCKRGDWTLWACARVGVDRKLIVRAACDCARLALKYVPDGEDRPRIAIESAERWCHGQETIIEVNVAACAAAEAAACAAAEAATCAAAAACTAAADFTRSKTLAKCADLVREHISLEAFDAALARGQSGEKE